jgi:hypothetical protein
MAPNLPLSMKHTQEHGDRGRKREWKQKHVLFLFSGDVKKLTFSLVK